MLTIYDIRTSNDLVSDDILAFMLIALATFGIGCAAASVRRPRGTRGRIAIAVMLSGFAATLIAAPQADAQRGVTIKNFAQTKERWASD